MNVSSPAFLLRAVLDFLTRINREKVLQDPLDFATFEFWMNHFSDLSDEENYQTRAKIIGKYIPREEYQVFFPSVWVKRIPALTLSQRIFLPMSIP